MRFITVTELRQKATQIVSEIETTHEQIVVTKNGKPVVLMQTISNGDFTLKAEDKEVKHGRARKEQ